MSIHASVADGRVFDAAREPTTEKGFWSRFWSGLIAAREREARLRVSQHLASFSDRQLTDIGFEASEIKGLRETGILPKQAVR